MNSMIIVYSLIFIKQLFMSINTSRMSTCVGRGAVSGDGIEDNETIIASTSRSIG